ncbi:MAG: ketol-acid reductoisomerase [candidate division Zixibacteria bacterium SM23_73_3]|nr:MAG: ketol-acid reductoisomerase [candidate division Zixibacteria bacterium SM23_73_3]
MRKKTAFTICTDRQANLRYLKDRIIAVIGYGKQGRAQALNLRDSGLDVIIGLPQKSKRQARQDGFEVYSTEEATQVGNLISILAPDHLHQEIYQRQIEPNLSSGKTLLFACGFSIHFQLVLPPDFVDVIMVAPHAPGEVMRRLFLQGKGVPCFIAVKQDRSGNAQKKALAYAKAIGCTKAGVFETTFEHEAIGDLFGEQAVLCGGLTQLLKAGFDILVDTGLPPENAYLECVHQLDFIVNTIKSYGIAGMFDRISKTAEFGSYLSGKRVITKQVKRQMEKILQEIEDGTFAKRWMKEYEGGMRNYRALKEQVTEHPIEKTGKKIRRLSR